MTDINGAVVLITGATGGFGRHMARQFHAAGGRVILTDLDGRALEALRSEFDTRPDDVLACIPADLSDMAGCRSLFSSVTALVPAPHILVNNAGIGVAGRLDHIPQDRWEKLMQINLLAPMRLCSLFLPLMVEAGRGHVVNISSLAGWVGSHGLSAYCASKFGLHGFSESIALDLEEQDVQVSTVFPSFSRTPILDSDQFGYDGRRVVPDDIISDPAKVVAAVVRGVQKNRRHIFPDAIARRVHYVQRYLPVLMPMMQRHLQKRSIPKQ